LTVEPASEDRLTVIGPYANATPGGPDNIVMRALALYREMAVATAPASITVEKNLPIASGIGGGSSDAAALLKVIDRINGSAAGQDKLLAIGKKLGADLPMCLHASPLVASGIGERIEPLARFPALAMVLVNPAIEISTPAIFKALESKENPALPELGAVFSPEALVDWLKTTRNDLERPAGKLFPQIAEARQLLHESGALFARMSGSGATFFGIFSDNNAAKNAELKIKSERPGWFAVATRTNASGDSDEPDG
jgi:4-diphosphocytidyl-2-C-methyl-D-erythritol kinase